MGPLTFSRDVSGVKTALTVWVRGKTDKMVGERSRRIEEVKAEHDAGVVPPFSGALVASNEKNHFHGAIRVTYQICKEFKTR
jgi:hypothetical protein